MVDPNPQPKIEVPLEQLQAAMDFIAGVNSFDLAQIVWTRDGNPVPVRKKKIESWKFTGLSNVYFAKDTKLFKARAK
jgi:hypothetical protein